MTPTGQQIEGEVVENVKAFAFTPRDAQEMFHITYDGEFVFAEGVEPEEAAKAFAKFFTEEMAPFTAIMSAAKAVAHSTVRRPHAGSILLPIELYDDLCEAVGKES